MSEIRETASFLSQFPEDELEEHRFDFALGSEGRCIQKMLFHRGRLVWFSIVQQTQQGDDWVTVVRADTCHDQAHLHRFTRRSKNEIQRREICDLSSIDDVEAGFDHASELITEEWEENLRRWNE